MKQILAILTTILTFATYYAFAQVPTIDVTEQTIKIGSMKYESIYLGFAEGDQIIFNLIEIDGKEIKEVEIIEYPSSMKFSDYKTAKIENKIIIANKTGVYRFRLYNSAVGARICKVKIQRIPANAQTKNFNTNVTWIIKQDTTWNTYTKDIIVGYDTTFIQKTKKELIKIDTTVIELVDKTERVFSQIQTLNNKPQFSYVPIQLPNNTYYPNSKNPYSSKEVVSWSYWIGVGPKAKEEYEKANRNLSLGIKVLGVLTGYGALAKLAISGISMFGTPSVGDNVRYQFITNYGGNNVTFDHGNGISGSGRNDRLLQGGFAIELFNDNSLYDLDAIVKVIAVQIEKTWQDKEYMEPKVTPKYGKKKFTDPIITKTEIPIIGQLN